ncbi:MAG: hypothetical protein CMJ81_13520 [Planctomycetaceae bacterium]|nr:hypothetical protein [Planctomycetaceae bacterium]MBP62539.1 hypothetical protein [Planctomycetaceae bacterium]
MFTVFEPRLLVECSRCITRAGPHYFLDLDFPDRDFFFGVAFLALLLVFFFPKALSQFSE